MEEKSFEDYWTVINHTQLTQLYFWSRMQDWKSTRKCPICQVTGGCLSRHSLWPLLETGSRARSVFGLTQCSHSSVLVKIQHCYKAHSNCSHLNSSYTILSHQYALRTQVQKSLTSMERAHLFHFGEQPALRLLLWLNWEFSWTVMTWYFSSLLRRERLSVVLLEVMFLRWLFSYRDKHKDHFHSFSVLLQLQVELQRSTCTYSLMEQANTSLQGKLLVLP